MADEQTQEQSLGTDYYLRKGIESEYKTDAPFMKEASNYALLFKYVQLYRIVSGKYGVVGRDNIHNYMIENADRLGLPSDLRSKTELSTYYTYAIQYSENGKRVATPEEVEYAKGEYEKKREEDWRDAKKKVEDHDKAIANAKTERASLRRKSFGYLMSHFACFNIGALGLTALVTIFGGVVSGAFAGIITTSMLGIGAAAGAIVFFTLGRKWLGKWWQTVKAHREKLKELRQKQNEIIAENKKEKKRKSVKAFNKVDARRTKDAQNSYDLEYLPEYTEYMENAQRSQNANQINNQSQSQGGQTRAASQSVGAASTYETGNNGAERVRTPSGSGYTPSHNAESQTVQGPASFTYNMNSPYTVSYAADESSGETKHMGPTIVYNGDESNTETWDSYNNGAEQSSERKIVMPRAALSGDDYSSRQSTGRSSDGVSTDTPIANPVVSPRVIAVNTQEGNPVIQSDTISVYEGQGEGMENTRYTEVEKSLIESGDKKAFADSLKARGYSKADINNFWKEERNAYLDEQMKVYAQGNNREAYNRLARERFGIFGFVASRRHWNELQAQYTSVDEDAQVNVPPKQDGVTHAEALDAYAKKDDKETFIAYYMAYVEPVSPTLQDLYAQSRENAERTWKAYKERYDVNEGSITNPVSEVKVEPVPTSTVEKVVPEPVPTPTVEEVVPEPVPTSTVEKVVPETVAVGSEFVVEGFNVRQSLDWYAEQISDNDQQIEKLQKEFVEGAKQLEEWAKQGVIGDNIKTTTVAHMEGEGSPYFGDLSKLRELQNQRKQEIARLQNENEELRRKKDGLEKDIKDGKVVLEPEEKQVKTDSNEIEGTSAESTSASVPAQPDKIYLDADSKKIYAFIENVDRAGFMKWAQQQGQTKDEAAKLWRLYADENFERKMNAAVRSGDRELFDEWAKKAGVTEKRRNALWEKKQEELANGTLKPEPIFIDVEAEAANVVEANKNSKNSNENLFKQFIAKQSKLRANPMKQGTPGSRSNENRFELYVKAVLAHQLQKHQKEQKDESTILYVEKLIKGARGGKTAVTKKDKEFYAALVNSDALERIKKYGYAEDFEEFLMYCEELHIDTPEEMVRLLEEQRQRNNAIEATR